MSAFKAVLAGIALILLGRLSLAVAWAQDGEKTDIDSWLKEWNAISERMVSNPMDPTVIQEALNLLGTPRPPAPQPSPSPSPKVAASPGPEVSEEDADRPDPKDFPAEIQLKKGEVVGPPSCAPGRDGQCTTLHFEKGPAEKAPADTVQVDKAPPEKAPSEKANKK